MKKTIWKITLKTQHLQDIETPAGAEILYVDKQHGLLCLWFLCDPAQPSVKRKIMIAGTGFAEVPNGSKYHGTVLLEGGHLVLHAFEVLP
jgi:hypothetical protein